ncbi:putative adenylyltransferase/sulfurtransferase MoeZ [Anatilimnocola aggregata]|uniref:Putative adenylyltransferase/sulfurtransferase MoeZ n=1 Tax=Anatilimnocola aggregata TaxID=2528021 RepID=A0A517YGN2_9BACT|nr:rhodanese-like domain-containing protein [Anatilimnocola aggregata]QDU29390.1 putative adenylyltransferase/sulfurtransferase MoeZ [Anatilimnocola aggregata]
MTNEPCPWEIDVQAVKQLLDSGADFTLLDCREPGEYQAANITGSKLIPMREIPGKLGELEPLKNSHIVVHCHHGGRSMRVTQWLREQGFSQVQNMAGGIDAWSQIVDPSVPRY